MKRMRWIGYLAIVVLELWLVYQYLQNPGELFSDPWQIFSCVVSLDLILYYGFQCLQMLGWWRKGSDAEENLRSDGDGTRPKKKRTEVILTSLVVIVLVLFFAGHITGNRAGNASRKQTVFASCETMDMQVNGAGKPVGVTIYKSRFPWIIQKTAKCYPKDMSKWWDQTEMEVPETLSVLPDGVNISWYRYYIKNKEQGTTETAEVIAADERTAQALQQEQDELRQAQREMQTAVDEVILKDNSRLVILNYGGGTDAASVEEAVQGFLEPLLKQ